MAKKLKPTHHTGHEGEHSFSAAELRLRRKHHKATDSDVIGPYFRKRAPFRAKVSPPLAKGETLVISGRVQGETGRPLAKALLEVWQANAQGHYDNESHTHPPPANVYINRARMMTDQDGRYEFETIYPGPYKMDPKTWRAPHIHYKVHARSHKMLITQLFFAGSKYLDSDPFVKRSLIIKLRAEKAPGGSYRRGTFNIVLAHRKRKTARKKAASAART